MQVGELFRRLSYGELSNLSIGDEGKGYIRHEDRDRVVSYADSALSQIYARFAHKRHYVTFVLDETRKSYKVAQDNPDLEPGGLVPGTVIKIIEAVIEDDPLTVADEREVLGASSRNSRSNVKVLGIDTVWVEKPKSGQRLTVEFTARPPRLNTTADLSEEIDVPVVLEPALEANVASRVYSAMNGELNIVKARELMAQYEEICRIVEAGDLLNETEIGEADRFKARGWI